MDFTRWGEVRCVLSITLAACLAASSATAESSAGREILEANCVKCHGPNTQKSGLRLDSLANALLGGKGGPALAPGQPDDSPLVRAVKYEDDVLRMPPSRKLSDAEVAALEAWVRAGAPWPGATLEATRAEADLLLEKRIASDEKLWALRPVLQPAVPPADAAQCANATDAFVLAKLAAKGLASSLPADRRTLIRRLYLDVLGLSAYEKLVDGVLASPHYGERWARHWLDVVRFAETNGFETNTPRNNAWPYRDYVIQSLNEDKPYTQFIREQLAGDALGMDAATGFLVGGPWDEVKSPDIVLTKNQRDAELHDMVSTIGSAFLGLTVGCAKCHNHKFDPISMRDYYGLRAMVEGVEHGERELRPPDAEERLAKAKIAEGELAQIERKLAQFLPEAGVDGVTVAVLAVGKDEKDQKDVKDGRSTAGRAAVQAEKNVERFPALKARYVRFTIFATSDIEPCIDELEVWNAGDSAENVALAERGAKASASSEIADNEKHKTVHLNDGNYGNDHSWIPAKPVPAWVEIELREAQFIDTIVWGRDREGKFKDRLPLRYALEVAESPAKWQLVATSWDRRPYEKDTKSADPYTASTLEQKNALEQLLKQRDDAQARIKDLTSFPRIYAGRFKQPEATHLLYRGDPMQERQAVAPAGPRYVRPALAVDPATPEGERRKSLGDWLASEQNPLTARVLVNRIWQHHFGRGIVATPSDFGAMGARPTHPELLDWLAAEFMANGWHMKPIHRLILLSNTYRQSSAPRAECLAADANCEWLWRFPPRRLEAEPIRDSILAVSGVLDPRMGGPGYHVFEPNDNYVRVYTPKTAFAADEWRRMVYQYKPRSQQDVTFGIFDCPDGGQTAPRRNTSTTPLQALNLLNSPFMLQQSELFAHRVKQEAGDDLDTKIQRAFALAFSRVPDAVELHASNQLIQDHGLSVLCRALYNASEFLYLN
ncbi:MAG: PSD1 domain-containing protein [Candidatus Hydrogenedentes bacterium]|nr:PSD1 domain-containing protein [Candidatus Hydrogenedentota bacterium]